MHVRSKQKLEHSQRQRIRTPQCASRPKLQESAPILHQVWCDSAVYLNFPCALCVAEVIIGAGYAKIRPTAARPSAMVLELAEGSRDVSHNTIYDSYANGPSVASATGHGHASVYTKEACEPSLTTHKRQMGQTPKGAERHTVKQRQIRRVLEALSNSHWGSRSSVQCPLLEASLKGYTHGPHEGRQQRLRRAAAKNRARMLASCVTMCRANN